MSTNKRPSEKATVGPTERTRYCERHNHYFIQQMFIVHLLSGGLALNSGSATYQQVLKFSHYVFVFKFFRL